ERAGTYARGRVPVRDRHRIDRHLDGCLSCREALPVTAGRDRRPSPPSPRLRPPPGRRGPRPGAPRRARSAAARPCPPSRSRPPHRALRSRFLFRP
ncbi:zf-HC2 domain-containing protein, partial [Rathayibacter sp. AY1C4]|uniref:zf-HC2 domain-containing protein n=1 Tax=Rathayibacter sp. AY1C4 TaxID=2080537 RepID=UPI0035BE7677